MVARKKVHSNYFEKVGGLLLEINRWNTDIRAVLQDNLRPKTLEVIY